MHEPLGGKAFAEDGVHFNGPVIAFWFAPSRQPAEHFSSF